MTVYAVVSQAAWAGNVVALPAVASLAGWQEWRHGGLVLAVAGSGQRP